MYVGFTAVKQGNRYRSILQVGRQLQSSRTTGRHCHRDISLESSRRGLFADANISSSRPIFDRGAI